MNEGNYLKLHRKIADWGWYKDIPTKVLFIHCLIKANWKPAEFMGVPIESGQFATSIPHLSEETGLTIRQVRTALKHLQVTGEVTVKRHGKFSVISIEKWGSYQVKCQSDDSQNVNQVTGERQASDNNRRNKEDRYIRNNNSSATTNESPKEIPWELREDSDEIKRRKAQYGMLDEN